MRPLAAATSQGLWGGIVVAILAQRRGCEARTVGPAERDAENGRRRNHEGWREPGVTTATGRGPCPSPRRHKRLLAVIQPSPSRSSVPQRGFVGTGPEGPLGLRMTREQQTFSRGDVPGRSVIARGPSPRRWGPCWGIDVSSRALCSPLRRGWITIVRLTISTPTRAIGRMRTDMG